MKIAAKRLALFGGIVLAGSSLGWGQKDPQVKSKKELEAFQNLQKTMQSGNADAELKGIDDFLEHFADTQFKVLLLQNATQIAQQKNDPALAVTYAQRTLEADPKNFEADATVAAITANGMKEFDLDKAEKTAKVQKYAQATYDSVQGYPKPFSQMPDAQWELQKKSAVAQAHTAVGIADMANKKYDDAITEFKTAADSAPDAVITFRLGEAYMKAGKLDDANATFDKVIAMADAPAQVKTYAQQRKADIAKLKAAAK